jgi:hypothetical protein
MTYSPAQRTAKTTKLAAAHTRLYYTQRRVLALRARLGPARHTHARRRQHCGARGTRGALRCRFQKQRWQQTRCDAQPAFARRLQLAPPHRTRLPRAYGRKRDAAWTRSTSLVLHYDVG